ncbi:MAG: transporter [Anaerocolumna sp.]|jgi:nitroimidazol reductase NimA-like FMN-containing flavoprotein (pyridoxamine 5'-phosphate oxidase superfamily)|nr:transporter [Anaerocolumna sp.]
MRRKDREITDVEEILMIMDKCDVCRIALFDEEYPYIVPLNFGYEQKETGLELYFHGAKEGKKLSLIEKNKKACFEMDCSHNLVTGEDACDYTMEFESVIGYGSIVLLEEAEKMEALKGLMKQYTKDSNLKFNPGAVKAVTVFKLVVEQITGKRLIENVN